MSAVMELEHLDAFRTAMKHALGDVLGRDGTGNLLRLLDSAVPRDTRVEIGRLLKEAKRRSLPSAAVDAQLRRRALDALDIVLAAGPVKYARLVGTCSATRAQLAGIAARLRAVQMEVSR